MLSNFEPFAARRLVGLEFGGYALEYDPRRSPLLRLWENWKDPESGEGLRTCTIITGEPNELVAQIHPRMPMILAEQHHAAWLGETDDGNLKALLVRTLPTRCACGDFCAGKQPKE